MSRKLVSVTRVSPLSGETNTIEMMLDERDLEAWQNGAFIQVALPYLSPTEREFLLTGITAQEWDDTFKCED